MSAVGVIRVIGGNMSGQNPRELAREFGVFREQRPDIEKSVHHVSLSAGESDKLSIKQWNKIAAKYVEQMGFGSSPYVVVQHIDAAHDHIHIVTSRIDLNGKVVPDFKSKVRAEEVMRGAEREHNLERVAPSRDAGRRAPTRGELEKFARTGELSVKMRLQDAVDWSLKDAPNVTEFIRRLDRIGVRVNPYLQHTGIASGISFERDGEVMKGSDLGRDYAWQGLQKRGLVYEQERDRKVLTEAKIRYLEAAQTRGKRRKDAGEAEREIAEWRHSLAQLSRPSSVASTREQTAQERSADAELNVTKRNENQLKTRDASSQSRVASPVSTSVSVKSKVLEGLEYERGNRDSRLSGIEALRQASNLNRSASSNDRETLAHAAGYELNRSAEDLLRDAATPVKRKKRNEREEHAAERVAPHQQSDERARDEKARVEETRIDKTQETPRDLTQQVPEQEASKTPEGKEIERTRERSSGFILSR